VGADAVVDRCLLADGAVIRSRESLFSVMKVRERRNGRPLSGLLDRDRKRGETRAPLPLAHPVPQRAGSA
jgi:hypothetical protein